MAGHFGRRSIFLSYRGDGAGCACAARETDRSVVAPAVLLAPQHLPLTHKPVGGNPPGVQERSG